MSARGENEVENLFSQAIERDNKGPVHQNMEEDESEGPPMKVWSKESRTLSYEAESEQSSQDAKVHPSRSGVAEQEAACLERDSLPIDAHTELAKKRLASRVSSRRTREREKLRMDHFRSAKVKLLDANKNLAEENQKLRSLIQQIRTEKAMRDRNSGGAFASMFDSNNQAMPKPSPGFAPLVPAAPQQHGQPDVSALLINALAQNMAQQQQQSPVMPSQEQTMMALLGLVANNPGIAHLVGQRHHSPQQQQSATDLSQLVTQMQYTQQQQSPATGLSQMVTQQQNPVAAGLSQMVAQMQHTQQQPAASLSQLVAQMQHSQHQQHPMNLMAALQGNANLRAMPTMTTNHTSQNLPYSNKLLSLFLGKKHPNQNVAGTGQAFSSDGNS